MTLTRVAVVRPERSTGELWTLAAFAVGFFFLGTWLLMLILGAVTPWHLSFWHTALVIIGARILQDSGSRYRYWTWPGKRGEKA